MNKWITLLTALSLVAASGCGQPLATGVNDDPAQTSKPPASAVADKPGNGGQAAPLEEPPAKPGTYKVEDVDKRIVEAHTRFSFDLFREAVTAEDEGRNVFLSPFSAAIALSMTMNGAGGETFEAMRNALGLESLTLDETNRANEVLADVLTHPEEGLILTVANSLWPDEGVPLKESFLAANKQHYGAETPPIDLQSDAAPASINRWVDEATRGAIPKLLEKPLSGDAILLLLNAVYFNGNWVQPFPEERTTMRPFATADGGTADVPMMFSNDTLPYLEKDGVRGVRIPYHGGASMTVLLPEEGTELRSFAERLTPEQWNSWKSDFRQASGTLGLPKFKLEYQVELKPMLSSLGMGVAFEAGSADFPNMTDLPENIYLSQVMQKTFVEVGERGTVAAAVTGVVAEVTSAPSETFELEVNRPFLFVIEDHRTGSILFIGAVERL
ncbi:serpin family protein [Paenibacillus sp.]|uniref:serpin family protein n=1 Tax=Paenibacillus sp. TaxID=58172 RepID=UPI002D4231BC|nr:serpin family protein [Paenibacillus sp.]HZG87208.1 serpin family protein [Paenibacillus sp.]